MHVAGREIARWTWQTFWWTPTPDDPQAPSSQAIAGLRPAQLAGAARNYAMSVAYDMTIPGQPNVGGQNVGSAIYAYNPYLEARFGPANLPNSLAGYGPDGKPANNNRRGQLQLHELPYPGELQSGASRLRAKICGCPLHEPLRPAVYRHAPGRSSLVAARAGPVRLLRVPGARANPVGRRRRGGG